MLRNAAIVPVLEQLNGNGIVGSMLMSPDGRVLCVASRAADFAFERALGAVAARAYEDYSSLSAASAGGDLHVVLVDLDGAKLGVTGINIGEGTARTFLLCCYGANVEFSALKSLLDIARHELKGKL